MPTKQLSSHNALALEHKYRMIVDGRVTKLPYTLAKKATRYPDWCVSEWHTAEGRVPMPAVRNSNLCEECKDILRSSWLTMARSWAMLQDAVHPSQSFGNGDRISGAGSLYPPLPIDVTVSDLMRDIRDAVTSTIDQLIQDRPDWRMPKDPTTDVLADQLAKWHVEYIACHPSQRHAWVVLKEAYEVSLQVDRQSERLGPADPTTRRVMVYGRCWQYSVNEDGQRYRCTGKLQGVLRDGLDGRLSEIRCMADAAHAVPESEWLGLLRRRVTAAARKANQ